MATSEDYHPPSPSEKSIYQKYSKFMTNPNVTLLSPFLAGIIFLLLQMWAGYVNCRFFKGRIVEEREYRELESERHKKNEKKMDEILQACQARNGVEQSEKVATQISTSLGHSSSEEDSENLHQNLQVTTEDSKLDIVISIIEEGLNTKLESIKRGSRILQFRVSPDAHFLAKLRNVVVDCTDVDKRFTAQLERGVFIRNANDVVEMKTLESDEVPVILRSIYVAGKLTIEGLHLENATIRAATSDECITLKNIKHPEECDGVQVCTWNVQLPSRNFEEVAVYALKTYQIDNRDVSVYSSIVEIKDNTLRAALRIGIPRFVLFTYIARQFYVLFQSVNWPYLDPWMLACFCAISSQCVPSRIDNVLRGWLEHVRLIIWAVYFSMRSFLSKQTSRNRRLERGKKSLNGDNFEAGHELPTESANAACTSVRELVTDAITTSAYYYHISRNFMKLAVDFGYLLGGAFIMPLEKGVKSVQIQGDIEDDVLYNDLCTDPELTLVKINYCKISPSNRLVQQLLKLPKEKLEEMLPTDSGSTSDMSDSTFENTKKVLNQYVLNLECLVLELRPRADADHGIEKFYIFAEKVARGGKHGKPGIYISYKTAEEAEKFLRHGRTTLLAVEIGTKMSLQTIVENLKKEKADYSLFNANGWDYAVATTKHLIKEAAEVPGTSEAEKDRLMKECNNLISNLTIKNMANMFVTLKESCKV